MVVLREVYKKFILDIESRPQQDLIETYAKSIKAPKTYKDEEKIKEYIENKTNEFKKKMSTDTDYADIICIGIKELGKEAKLYGKDIEQFFKENDKPIFITYNGKQFDIPLLIKWGIKNNLDLPYQYLKRSIKRWSTEWHIDLQEIICDNDYKSLDTLLQIYLGISKEPIDFETASDKEIKEHCLEDLLNEELIYNKFKVII